MTQAHDSLAGLDPVRLAALALAPGDHVRITYTRATGTGYTDVTLNHALVMGRTSSEQGDGPSGTFLEVRTTGATLRVPVGAIVAVDRVGSDGRLVDERLAELERDVPAFRLVADRPATMLDEAIDALLEACAALRHDTTDTTATPAVRAVLAAGLNLSRVRLVMLGIDR